MRPVSRLPSDKLRETKNSVNFNASTKTKLNKKEFKLKETEMGYHYEMEVPGYVKEDFRFYISGNNLVVTTEKEKNSATEKHSYCYPSALFKMKIPLPKLPVDKRITVEYRDKILYFSLYKLSE